MTSSDAETEAGEQIALEGRALTRRFGEAYALKGVDFVARSGRVHALLGHNGAGKSTLISLMSGALAPTDGEIVVRGSERPDRWSPAQAIRHGIAVIYQHLSLVESLSVADNIFLGGEARRGGLVDRRSQSRITAELLMRLGASCGPEDRVRELPMAQRQLVEIAKALHRDAKVLILDEPTASLSARESDALSVLVDRFRSEGIAIVYVTHLLAEVERLADDVTVLEGGRVQWSGLYRALGHEGLVRLLTKGSATSGERTAAEDAGVRETPRDPMLEVAGFAGRGFGPLDLYVRRGETIVLFGMLGSGRGEFMRAIIAGSTSSGTVALEGSPTPIASVRDSRRRGVFYVGPDRKRDGLFPGLSTRDNVLMTSFAQLADPLRSRAKERDQWQVAAEAVALGDVATRAVDRLSGGNQQKAVVGRALAGAIRPRLVLLDEPTQGVDIGARRDIYRAMGDAVRDDRLAVVVSTNDPEETVALADRAYVFAAGSIVAELSREQITEERLIALASATNLTDGMRATL